jgi:diaminopimelate decarboxylase
VPKGCPHSIERRRFGLTKNDRLIYEEIARVRYLVGNGFRLLLGSDEKAAATWKKVAAQVDQRSERIADDLLSRRQQ